MKCPNCEAEMESVGEPDLTTERCSGCGGIFLDHSELNKLATGMSGDIEYCSVDHGQHADVFRTRRCPKCSDSTMSKVELLRYTDIIFDHCPTCRGFFLDKGEREAMNAALAKMAGREDGEEQRTTQDGHLITIDRVDSGVFPSGAPPFTLDPVRTGLSGALTLVKIVVHFGKPLGIGLRVHSEEWTAKLAKVFHLFRQQDINTGNKQFDASFIIQATDEGGALKALTQDAQEALVAFANDKPQLVLQPGSLQVLDDRIVYTEGPYAGEIKTDIVAVAPKVVDRMIAIADMIEGC